MSAPVPTADHIMLVGFMGAGKSTVGRLLARRLGRCFVETDDMIVAREGRMARLRTLGTVVWLKGDFGEMYERAGGAGLRPMLAERSRAEVEALYREREPHYRAAHLVIETRGLGVDQVVGRILRALPQSHGARV